MSFLISLLICLILNIVVADVVSLLVPDYYLANIVTSVILAFIISLISLPEDKLHFYRNRRFYLSFFTTAIIFLILDAVFFLI